MRFPTLTAARRAGAAGVLLAVAAPAGAQQRVSLGTGDVAVYDLVGEVRLVAGAGGDAVAEVTMQGADAARLQVQSGPIGGRSTLRVIFPGDRVRAPGGRGWGGSRLRVRDDGTFGDEHERGSGRSVSLGGDGLDARANVTLSVPAGRTVAIYLGAGSATVTNVDGHITVHAHMATVTTSNTRGSLTLDTGSGETQVTNAQGTLNLDSGSGSVTVRGMNGDRFLVDAGSGELRADGVTAGEVRLDLGSGGAKLTAVNAPALWIDSGSGEVDVDLRSVLRSLKVDSGSGDVTIRVPRTTGAQLEIDAGSGGYQVDLPVTFRRRSHSHLSGSVGDGSGRIDIDSGSGEVRILAGA